MVFEFELVGEDKVKITELGIPPNVIVVGVDELREATKLLMGEVPEVEIVDVKEKPPITMELLEKLSDNPVTNILVKGAIEEPSIDIEAVMKPTEDFIEEIKEQED